ncbi:hypothetical protein M2163_005971 [Streptomyces sp. SAI-135]|uniref:DUF3710 domain-containing protein n=1 Tax=unclassified Streptomyces TaxID=2593676 RepID=UPI002473E855|nr:MULTISPECIES: DUF3710 domain-containing protein [unclassified Streptomyces]MDH6517049.1 hypothetical protein [Streptomyces sp. SAI-090]MDH6568329.1 hypothetical protein [Streptomyces sp. SAI-117]MDH6618863.1 hypothetical protein [Streptomyces sp. SAI-135]
MPDADRPLGEASSAARAVVAQFRRDGFVATESAERAEFDVWDRMTAGRVLLVALQMLLKLREEDGRNDLGRPVRGLDEEEARLMVRTLLGDAAAAPETSRRDLITLDRLLELLASVIAEEPLSDEAVDALLEAAEESCLAVGPWDESDDRRPRDVELIDLGGLLVPTEPGLKIELNPSRKDGAPVGVTLIRGRATAIQLQAFRALGDTSWATVREDLARTIRSWGGSAEERVGPAGPELQAVVRVQGPPGKDRQTTRVLGHDGPGWILRGFVTGFGAEPDSTEEWPYSTFQGTVVRMSAEPRGDDPVIRLRLPESGA